MGRLDGGFDGEIFGWALDRNEPSVPPKVNIYVDSRPVGEVLPVWYRPDVGQHAFFFDLTSVCAATGSAQVEAKFSNPQPLANSPLELVIPSRSQTQRSPAVLFMHIPKTAGTAFREAIITNYRASEVGYIYPDPPGFLLSQLENLPLAQRAKLRFVIGHFLFGLHTSFPQESTYVTIVRDPVRRVISHFYYLLAEFGPTNKELASLLVEILERQQTVNLDNLMVRCFSGVPAAQVPPGAVDRGVYEIAAHNLQTQFKFVGYQEYSDEAYAALRKQFGWTGRASLKTVNTGKAGRSRSVRVRSIRYRALQSLGL